MSKPICQFLYVCKLDSVFILHIYTGFNSDICSRRQLIIRNQAHISPYKPIDLLQDVFVNQLTILVKKRQMIEINVEEGWFSESELKIDLKWSTY